MSMLSFLAETFEGKLPKRPSFASAELESGHGHDDHSSLHHTSSAELPDHELVGITIGLEYVDAEKNVSRRWVTIVAFADDLEGRPAILGHCFMRKGLRTFCVDRIINIFNEGGDTYDVREFLHLDGHATKSKIASAAYRSVCRDGLRVLIAVARSDGYLHPKEVEIIMDYAQAEGQRLGVEKSPKDLESLKHYIERQQPSGSVVSACLKRLHDKDEETQDVLLKYLEMTIYADGVLDDAEINISNVIKERLAH